MDSPKDTEKATNAAVAPKTTKADEKEKRDRNDKSTVKLEKVVKESKETSTVPAADSPNSAQVESFNESDQKTSLSLSREKDCQTKAQLDNPETPPCKQQMSEMSPLQELTSVTVAPVIPVDILSPPKSSESQTDETNTATTSPASDAQLSPKLEICEATADVATNHVETKLQPVINVVANGTMPKTGKPQLATITKKTRPVKTRKPKALVALYESEISHNKMGIKLCIKKSDSAPAFLSASAKPTVPSSKNRKRSRKSKPRVDSDDSEYETKKKKERSTNNNGVQSARSKKVSFSGGAADVDLDAPKEITDQSPWASTLPEELLYQIFQNVVSSEGSLPTLCRLGRVCTLWRRASLRSSLWKSMDLSNWIKEKYRTELKLKWFIDNRCSACTDLNISNWKITNIDCFLHKLADGCPNLQAINLTGWKGFTCDHLEFLVDNMKKLERLDLSSINVEMNPSKSAVGLNSLRNALSTMGERLTHLYLAHNRLPGIPQIINSLSAHCPNLLLLDLSNIFTQAASHAVLHVETLQRGCQKLKVLRVTNSRFSLNSASMQEMMDSPGFPDLEELSVASSSGDESRLIGDEHLQRILKSSSKLKLLDVRGCMRLTHESLIRLPAWDIKHLFLSGCSVTRDYSSRLELIASKWAHSLIELDLAWTNVQQPLDSALRVLAEKGLESPLAHLNLCGSSVSEDAVKDILANCVYMSSINLSSCRGLPRGVKRLIQGPEELRELREVLKVQMKFKLPTNIKVETIDAQPSTSAVNANHDDGGGGGGGDSSAGGGRQLDNNN